ncbi:beta-N-acetylglucosaminidase domain-containing protein [Sinosporangium siamense]|uniref:Hyaluronoglucosaminidase n=1 Tax=Sinosporangium siamense TaxID=1367973 RepID=A0A919RGC0_9ACTN|nr:beta-N-acetylglucosaminidase domain-containing protein [Sinosporangium siamense]GII91299.1 hypothetical protein Ssi02_15300 [Sinosporangium siamense]
MAPTRFSATVLAATLVASPLFILPAPALADRDRPEVRISPVPQQLDRKGDGFTLPSVVGLVRTTRTDPQAEALVRKVLQDAGVRRVKTTDGTDPRTGVTVWLDGNQGILDRLRVKNADGLKAEGYVLAAGEVDDGDDDDRRHNDHDDDDDRKHIVLDGVDARGTYYAALSFSQIVERGRGGKARVPGVEVRDWPLMRYRGSIEGFYGAPWTHQERLDHLDYLGAHKMNTYEYAPKDDPYHRDKWRDPYPPDKLAQLGELVTRAAKSHVDFTFALSPGLTMCYSSADDVAKLVAKFDSVYALGGRAFTVALDDIDHTRWNCAGDQEKYGAPGGYAAGKAQSDAVNAVQAWAKAKGDVQPIQVVPTEFSGVEDSPYKKGIREQLDPQVVVQWTGVSVVPGTIKKGDAAKAKELYGHEILIWDNYPVNDYAVGRLLLGAYDGREPGLSEHVAGVVSNPMNQASGSKVALYSFADFGWNDKVFEPEASRQRAFHELAGGKQDVVRALTDFADLNTYNGTLHAVQAPLLAPQVAKFWADRQAGRPASLRAVAERLAAAPEIIRRGVADEAFLSEAKAWLDAAELWARAMLKAHDALDAVSAGDGAAGLAVRREVLDLVAKAKAVRDLRWPHSVSFPLVGDGVVDVFVTDALKDLHRWLGVNVERPAVATTFGTTGGNTIDRAIDGDPATYFWSNRSPNAGDTVTVDLRAPRLIGDVAVLMSKADSPEDYIRGGVLEHSADGSAWTEFGTGNTAEVRVTAPAGTRARYVRYRVTEAAVPWLVLREFSVATLDESGTALTVTGTPEGTGLPAAVDGDLDTSWAASAAPAEGDALQVAFSTPRIVDRVAVVGTGRADVQVRASGEWRSIGALAGPYTELDMADASIDAVRLVWTAGSEAPRIAEVVPHYGDGKPAGVSVEPAALDTVAGRATTVKANVVTNRAAPVSGAVSVIAPEGWTVPAAQQVTVPRGGGLVLPVEFTAPRVGKGTVKVVFTPAGGDEAVSAEVAVSVHRPVAPGNIALNRPASASSVEEDLPHLSAKFAFDGDKGATRWSSVRSDDQWIQVELAQATDVGKVTLHWESAYGADYRVELSTDGVTWTPAAEVVDGDGGTDEIYLEANSSRFVRVQGVRRATGFGYSLWEMEVHAAS